MKCAISVPSICWLLTVRLVAADVVVNNTNDTGPGSLRAAIELVNTALDESKITFNIPGDGVHVISPATALPVITNTVTIDGYSQPGARPNTLVEGNDAVIRIEIRATLLLKGFSSVVRGLSVQGLNLMGDAATVQGNFIGVDPSGTNKMSNGTGIYLNSTFEHQIGGTSPADRNVISGNAIGISGFGAPNPISPPEGPTRIQGNYIGTDKTGRAPLGNNSFGISISEPLQLIGGTDIGAGNIIAFNGQAGISLTARSTAVQIWGNSIFSNGGPGIANAAEGPTISSASPGASVVQGTFIGTPNQAYWMEVFSSIECDESGFGEGATWIGAAEARTGADGQGSFSASVPALTAGARITATATPLHVNGTTSGFSHCTVVAPNADLGLIVSGPGAPISALSDATFSVTITNHSATPATGIFVTVQLPDTMEFVSASPGWTNRFRTITTLIPGLDAGAAVTATITVQPRVVGLTTATLQLLAEQPDANLVNNRAAARVIAFNPSPRQWVVTNTASFGPGSLSSAFNEANRGVGGDTITFQIPGPGVHVIDSPFVSAMVPITIDGYTQPGASPNTLETGNNAVLLIDLGKTTLQIAGGHSTVRGLVAPFIHVLGTSGGAGGSNVIEGCFIGTDASGRAANTNVSRGVTIMGADDTRIGGTTPAARNIIVAAGESTAAIQTDSARTIIQGNYIGTDASGTLPLGNGGAGIFFSARPQVGGLVGGTNNGAGNIIAFNKGPGIVIAEPDYGLSILGNSIFANGGIGVDLGTEKVSVNRGPLTNAFGGVRGVPLITSVSSSANLTRVQGYLQGSAEQAYRLEFFSSPRNTNAFYQSEGKVFLGFTNIATDVLGEALFDISFPQSSQIVSVTATDPAENTSAFAAFDQPDARCFEQGDLLIGFLGDGHLQWRGSAGEPIRVIFDGGTDSFSELAFSPEGTLWGAKQTKGTLERFSQCGQSTGPVTTGASTAPAAITFDAAGNVYVGFHTPTNIVSKYDSSGRLLDQYTVAVDFGLESIDLAADQKTLFYATRGRVIRRYDVVARQQLPDFVSQLAFASSLRVLPDGGLLVADFRSLLRFDASGKVVWVNNSLGTTTVWMAVRLDPDGTTFWAAGTGSTIGQFDLSTGALLQRFQADVAGNIGSLAVVGEPTAAGGSSSSMRPSLSVVFQDGQAVLRWSAPSDGFVLQSSPTLGVGAQWQTVPGAPSLIDGRYAIPRNPTGQHEFYRLLKQ